MRYENLRPVDHAEVEAALMRDDADALIAGIDFHSHYGDDPQWTLDVCLRCVSHPRPEVRAVVARGLGTLARVHPELPADAVLDVLRPLVSDPEISGYAADAIADVEASRPKSVVEERAELVNAVRLIASGKVDDLTRTLASLNPDIEDDLRHPGGGLVENEQEAAALTHLVSRLDLVLDSASPEASDEEIMRDPRWQEVRVAAGHALEALERRDA